MRHALFARTIRGIEWIAAAEIARAGTVHTFAHREVHFEAEVGPGLLELGTVDDVFVTCARIGGIPHTRDALATFEEAGEALPFDGAIAARAAAGGRPEPRDFEVVASFLGRRNYNRFDIEDAVARGISSKQTWRARSRRGGLAVADADLTVRVHIREEEAVIGVRLGAKPLHRRTWKIESPPGSLHPPVARAMVMLAGDGRIVDPFCGAGTIVIEAGGRAAGSDIDARAVGMAVRNAARAGVDPAFCVAKALAHPFGRFDAVVSNLPWGRAATLRGSLGDAVRACRSLGDKLVLLTEEELRGDFELKLQVSMMGAHPTLHATSVPEELRPWLARAEDSN